MGTYGFEVGTVEIVHSTADDNVFEPVALSSVIRIISKPPGTGTKYRVTNLYIDIATGKLTLEYDDTPI